MKQEMQLKGMFNAVTENVKCFPRKQMPSKEDREWCLRIIVKDRRWKVSRTLSWSWENLRGTLETGGKQLWGGRCAGTTSSGSTEKLLLKERRGTGGKTLCPIDGAAGAVALTLCQLPLTHLLAALQHWVEVPAPQCGHMPMIQAPGSAEKSLRHASFLWASYGWHH